MDAPPVQYVKTSDGYDIAYCVSGAGRALLTAPWPHSNLQIDWGQPGDQAQLMRGLAARFRLVQYDARGQGLSSRDLPADTTCDDFLLDMEAVVSRLGIDRFILYGWGNAMGHVALHYAARHTGRVEALILQCSASHASAWPTSLFVDLPTENWDYYLRQVARARVESQSQLVAQTPILDAETVYNNLNRSVHQRDWLLTLQAFLQAGDTSLLSQLDVPTLILHQRDFRPLPVAEAVKLAACIANSRLVLLNGSGLFGSPPEFLSAVDEFVAGLPSESSEAISGGLSSREAEVLRLLAAGRSNQQIADELVISLNTVRRHVSNIFDKTGVANRTEAASYATRNGIA